MQKCSAFRGGCDNKSDNRCYAFQQLPQCSIELLYPDEPFLNNIFGVLFVSELYSSILPVLYTVLYAVVLFFTVNRPALLVGFIKIAEPTPISVELEPLTNLSLLLVK